MRRRPRPTRLACDEPLTTATKRRGSARLGSAARSAGGHEGLDRRLARALPELGIDLEDGVGAASWISDDRDEESRALVDRDREEQGDGTDPRERRVAAFRGGIVSVVVLDTSHVHAAGVVVVMQGGRHPADRETGGTAGAGRPRVVVVGAGFAGFQAAKSSRRRLGDEAEIVLVSPTDYFLYLPLLPEVAVGILEPRRISVSLTATLPGVRLVLGVVDRLDVAGRRIGLIDPEGRRRELDYDRLVISVGSVNKLLPVPGVAAYAHGFRGIPEALYLRDHLIRQLELAGEAADPAERRARCTVLVVGAGYTGTEVAAHGKLFTDRLAASHRSSGEHPVHWLLLDVAPRVLPELDEHLSRTADAVLRGRGVDVRMGVSIDEATEDGVRLTTGEELGTRTVVWCVGVRPDPLVESLGLPTHRGRLVVNEDLTVPGHPEILACGDAAAVPDRTSPGQATAMTAQHAVRQGRLAGRNVAASLRRTRLRRYRHHDLGFVVDLGGRDAAANPLGVPLAGLLAKVVTRGYHLLSMPGNRLHTAVDWALDATQRRQSVQLGLVRSPDVPLDTASPELPRHGVPTAR